MLRRSLGGEVGPLDVHGKRAVKVLRRRAREVLVGQHAGVEHQDVQSTEPGDDLGDEPLALGGLRGVRFDRVRALGAEFGDEGVGGRGRARVVYDDRGPARGEEGCDRGADAAGGAGDEGHSSSERHVSESLVVVLVGRGSMAS